MKLEALEAESESTFEQRSRLFAVPGVDPSECLQPTRVGGTRFGNELESERVDLGSVDDRHDDATLYAGFVHPANGLCGLELPADRWKVVDVEMSVDDHTRTP